MNKAVFINLDNTLIETRTGSLYPLHSGDWKLIIDTVRALEVYYTKGYDIIIIANQLDVIQGFISEAVLISKLTDICKKLERHYKFKTNSIKYIYDITNKPFYNKPNAGLLYDTAMDYEINLGASVIFGSSDIDSIFAKNSGVGEYYDIESIKSINWIERASRI